MYIYGMALLLRWIFTEVLSCGLSVGSVYYLNVIGSQSGVESVRGFDIYSASFSMKKMLKKLRIFT